MPYELIRNSLGAELFDAAASDLQNRALPAEIQAANLSLAEKVAVYAWTIDTSPVPWFARINAWARGADLPPGEADAVLPVTTALRSALEKLPPFVGTVYRGIKERPIGADEFERFVREHETLPEVYHPGFVGAAAVEFEALRGRCRLVIQSKTGRDISSLSSKPSQREVLFMPPLKVSPTLVERRKGWVKIWVSEI